MSGDPYVAPNAVAEPQGWNRYGYVGNDPVNKIDPAGTDGCSVMFGWEFCWADPQSITVTDTVLPVDDYIIAAAIPSTPDEARVNAHFSRPHGGGGGGGVSTPVDWVTQDWAQNKLESLLNGFSTSHCGAVFREAGLTVEALRGAANNTRFYDVRNPGYGNLKAMDVVGGSSTAIIGQSSYYGQLAGHFRGPRGNAVALYAEFWGGGVGPQSTFFYAVQASSLLHEVVHSLGSNWNDARVASNTVFQAHGLVDWYTTQNSRGSNEFTLWLANDCRTVPVDWH